ncbi:tumor necrosis factor ligand superfamily member 15-like [Liolophura sinensis]|uniref:tumor necrosis factor ligand superfamily member 15-like n=1 Tax=Liolophura sinensis TaxID=3198878 RepID=UPI00315819CF
MEMDDRQQTLSADTDVEQDRVGRRTPRHKPWYTKSVRCILLTLVLMLLAGVVGFLVFQSIRRSHGPTDSYSAPQNLMCVPCKDAGVTLPEAVGHKRHHVQGPLCCFSKGSSQVPYTSFSSKAAQALEQEKKDRPCHQSVSSRPSAFLFLDYPKTGEMGDTMHWSTQTPFSEGTGHLSDSLKYNRKYGGLIVPENGVYKVYSQVTFRQLPRASGPTLYIHCLFLLRAHQEEGKVVICSKTTKMNVTDARTLQPSYFQAEINVNSGDTLFVNVSDISSVFSSYGDSYFGLSKQ